MPKSTTKYVCQSCGYSQPKWGGKCTNCGEWNTLVETIITPESNKRQGSAALSPSFSLSSVVSEKISRISSGSSEFDRVLGGGLVPGHVVLLAGEPGIGKSTLLLQISERIKSSCIYVSGEESPIQIKLRADRLGIKGENITLLDETNVDSIINTLESGETLPSLVIVDSIQTLKTTDLMGIPGSVGQVRECASRLTRFAKSKKIPIILVGQVTKVGSVAGPATLAHMVDTVCWFEGETEHDLRIIRSIKNRFGNTDEIGVFRMTEKGLMAVSELSELFVSGDMRSPGASVASVLEGTRPLLVEIQSLVVPTRLPVPKRVASGLDLKRVDVILAVLAKHGRLPIYDNDVFVNAVGGISVKEPAADLSIALSLVSSIKGKPLPKNTVAIGEVGLLGEIRSVNRETERTKQAKRQGFKNVITSKDYPSIQKLIKDLF